MNNNINLLIEEIIIVYNQIDVWEQSLIETELDKLLVHIQQLSKAKQAKDMLVGYHCMGNDEMGYYVAPPDVMSIYTRHQPDSMNRITMTINEELPCGSSEVEAWTKAYDKWVKR